MIGKEDKTFKVLEPFLVVDGPNAKGWWDAQCPLHNDKKRSAGFHFDKGLWSCRAGCGSGSLDDLIERIEAGNMAEKAVPGNGFVDADIIDMQTRKRTSHRTGDRLPPAMGMLQTWATQLQSDPEHLEPFIAYRGINAQTLDDYYVGWNPDWTVKEEDGSFTKGAYTVPILDKHGRLLNVRLYRLPNEAGGTKIWSWGSPNLDPLSLYPEQVLDENETVVLAEGEWDALLTNQMGFPAVTGTTGAGNWQDKWNHKFAGKVVYICYDRDEQGERSARHVYARLKDFAKAVYIVELPMPFTKKHGEDLTDYFIKYGRTADDFKALLYQYTPMETSTEAEPAEVSVRESYNPALAGKPMAMTVTIIGRTRKDHLLPWKLDYTCNMDAGTTCRGCPMTENNGHMKYEINPDNRVVLEMRDATEPQVKEIARKLIGAHKCGLMHVERDEEMNIELLNVRTSVDYSREDEDADFRSRSVVNVGKYKTQANQTVRMVGTIYASPRDQESVFQSWRLEPVETSMDTYELTKRDIKLMQLFVPGKGEPPLRKMARVAVDLSHNVTRIVDRLLPHIGMDLVWHSVIGFDFDGHPIEKGWLDALFLGDTRTGKSEIAQRLRKHYGLGAIISCESASIPGILGAVKPLPGGKGWNLEWGALPLNDRRLLVLDEAGGLTHEQIGQLSSVRSSGIAEIEKAERESTRARTRLVWLANPRDNQYGMSSYLYGVQAIQPLIGNQEDIARFDFAMTLASDEVSMERINTPGGAKVRHVYTDEACHALLRWVWSRNREQVCFSDAAVEAAYEAALDLATRYAPDPPLIQGANVRTKVARIAAAIAARTFSTDAAHELLMVKAVHVQEAVNWLDKVYQSESFGYGQTSRKVLDEQRAAIEAQDEAYEYIKSYTGLSRFLYACNGQFRRQQLEEVLNKTREEANAIIQKLVGLHMIRSASDFDYRIQPQLNIILRDRIKE